MDSDFQQQQYQHHFQDLQRQFHRQKQQVNSLTRFRSAPSSYFSSFLDVADSITSTAGAASGGDGGDFSTPRPLSPETENIFAKFLSSMDAENNTSSSHKLNDIPERSQAQPGIMVKVKQEDDTSQSQQQQQQREQQHKLQQREQQHKLQQQQQSHFNTSSQMIYHSASKPPLANQHSSGSAVSSPMGSSFRGIAGHSNGMNFSPQMKIGIGGNGSNINSGLTRYSSSPAGFFSDLNIEGFDVLKGMSNYGGASASNDQMNYSSGQSSSTPGLIRQNSDTEEKLMRMTSLEETRFSNPGNNQNNDNNYGLPISSWQDSIMTENFSGPDKGDDDIKPFSDQNLSDNQNGESRNRLPLLAHHLSLPKTSGEIAAMEKLLELHDSVPLRIRAKRGCATHPRSIAERVRRTRISERMRKLQDLVPNMDKQTNTSDMLDLAVDYIKDLQTKVKTLHDNRAKCTCSR